MKSGIILYQSKYGATKKYADWLRERTGFACVETPSASPDEAARYETIVLCGGVYASGIAGLGFLKRNIAALRGRKLAVLCVGASPYDEAALEAVRARNLQGELADVPLFYARGAWDESAMTWKDRTLCRLLQKAVAKKAPADCEPWMRALLCAAGQRCDWTDAAYLTPLLRYLGE